MLAPVGVRHWDSKSGGRTADVNCHRKTSALFGRVKKETAACSKFRAPLARTLDALMRNPFAHALRLSKGLSILICAFCSCFEILARMRFCLFLQAFSFRCGSLALVKEIPIAATLRGVLEVSVAEIANSACRSG
jgi:hypothetical protein